MRAATVASTICLAILVAASAGADVLQEANELRRQLQYDAATEKLAAALPSLRDEARARALLLLATVNADPKEARRQLLEASKAAIRNETREAANFELARLDYGRGNYRSVQARLQDTAGDPQAALWLAMSAVALGNKAEVHDVLQPARKLEFAQLLSGWAELQAGETDRALATLEPLARRRSGDGTATALYWKAQVLAAKGDRDAAVEIVTELHERWGGTPEARMSESLVGANRDGAGATSGTAPPPERLALQVGSFEDRANALRFRERIAQDVRSVRAPVRVEETQNGAQRLYRVVVGTFESRDAAEAFGREQLTDRGVAWQVVHIGEESRP